MCLPKERRPCAIAKCEMDQGSVASSGGTPDSGWKDILSQWGLPKSTSESGFCPESVAGIRMHSKACGGCASAPNPNAQDAQSPAAPAATVFAAEQPSLSPPLCDCLVSLGGGARG